MCLLDALKVLHQHERESDSRLSAALSITRYYSPSSRELLRNLEVWYLPAINAKARMKWTTVFITEMYRYFDLDEQDEGPDVPIFLVTIADKRHLTSARAQNIDFPAIQRKLSGVMQGLHYVGMIEPAYYNCLYDERGHQVTDIVSWHGHFLVWETNRPKLETWRRKILSRIQRVIPHRCAIHIKRIPCDQLGHRLWYVNKSPRTEYSVGRRSKSDIVTGLPRYKQNKRELRPGHRVSLFHLLRNVTLPQLAMAGGEGSELLRKIKYEARRDYRRRNSRR